MSKRKENMKINLTQAKEIGDIGRKIHILLTERNELEIRLDSVSKQEKYSSAVLKLGYIGSFNKEEFYTEEFEKKTTNYSEDYILLEENMVNELSKLEEITIKGLRDLYKLHLEGKIELIDQLLNNLIYEKSNSCAGESRRNPNNKDQF